MAPMRRLCTVDDAFEAKLIATRLSADGVLCELRGGVDVIFPIGHVHIYVLADDLELATELLRPVELTDDDVDEAAF